MASIIEQVESMEQWIYSIFPDQEIRNYVMTVMADNIVSSTPIRHIVQQNGESLLKSAIARNKLDFIKLLLDKGASLDPDAKGNYTLLHDALDCNTEEIAIELINRGVDIDEYNDIIERPMRIACRKGLINVVKLLIAKGSNIEDAQEDRENISQPIYAAISHDRLDIVRLLHENGAALHNNIFFVNSIEMLKLIIDLYGTDCLNKTGAFGQYLLASKMRYRPNVPLIMELIKLGADVNKTNSVNNYTPLHLAVNTKSLELVKMLLDYGAYREDKDSDGVTAAKHAYNEGLKEIGDMITNYKDTSEIKTPES